MKLHRIVASDDNMASTACGRVWRWRNLRTASESEVAIAYNESTICGTCRRSLIPARCYVEAQVRNP